MGGGVPCGVPGQGWGTLCPGMEYPPMSRDVVTPPPPIGQQVEYLIRGGRYASWVHAGGLSCFYRSLPFPLSHIVQLQYWMNPSDFDRTQVKSLYSYLLQITLNPSNRSNIWYCKCTIDDRALECRGASKTMSVTAGSFRVSLVIEREAP